MKFIRLYTGDDQKSHFANSEEKLSDIAVGKLSNPIAVDQLFLGEMGAEKSWIGTIRRLLNMLLCCKVQWR